MDGKDGAAAARGKTALVIGGGPAGLMSAEEMARAGLSVVVADRMPSLGRKFLMAGKSGLNLTKYEDLPAYLAAFGEIPGRFRDVLASFGPAEAMAWAEALDQPVFTGSSGRVFPRAMKASPLLRAWLVRLMDHGVTVRTRWRWVGWHGDRPTFETPDGWQTIAAAVTVLACGGASWPRLGSDGAWAGWMPDVAPFAPANAGLRVTWSDHMARLVGQPVKAVAWRAGKLTSRGEAIVTAAGLEGGGIYAVLPAARESAAVALDLLPDLSAEDIARRLARLPARASLTNRLRKALGLDPVKIALLHEFARPLPRDPAALLKALPVRHLGPMPLDGAISTAGGMRLSALDGDLMLRARPGVFAAGEMLDWEAPTGGYLITACLATGRHAGRAAARFAGTGASGGDI